QRVAAQVDRAEARAVDVLKRVERTAGRARVLDRSDRARPQLALEGRAPEVRVGVADVLADVAQPRGREADGRTAAGERPEVAGRDRDGREARVAGVDRHDRLARRVLDDVEGDV